MYIGMLLKGFFLFKLLKIRNLNIYVHISLEEIIEISTSHIYEINLTNVENFKCVCVQ